MTFKLKEWVAKVTDFVNRHDPKERTIAMSVGALGRSFGANYVNVFFPIPYIPEGYTATLDSVSVVNLGAGTVANYYSFSPNFIYVRINRSGITSGSIQMVTARAVLTVGGGYCLTVFSRLSGVWRHCRKAVA